MPAEPQREILLQVQALAARFRLLKGTLTAVQDVSFEVFRNEILAIVGESGCGKSVTLLSIMNLIQPPGMVDGGSRILFQGRDLLHLSEEELSAIRGDRIAMIFQEPSVSFNPLFRVGSQIAETLSFHRREAGERARRRSVELLRQVRIPSAERRVRDYPFQLSGGMLQRAMIAMALSCSPSLLLADEPTTALDATVQAQVLSLLKEHASAGTMSVIFVTHDIALIDGFADRVLIMYAGRILESGGGEAVVHHPLHPYTGDLLRAFPRLGVFKDEQRLFSIPGRVPDPSEVPRGCTYAPRCSRRFERCEEEPPLFAAAGPTVRPQAGERLVRCWLYEH